ncbi:MAG: ROK family transcriptional regulator [Bifidobacteriaceae bacterium]|jgi:predicted NBD/HSP70 family sugar kinase|nr:ROK family transcriptional regulator [Bifidobacteriaceae bacterium]
MSHDDLLIDGSAPGPRDRTRESAYRLIRETPGITRAQITQRLGIVPTTANDVVRRLIEAGRVVERRGSPDTGGHRRGRPSAGLEATVIPGYVGGIDFGHQHIAVGIGDTRGVELAERHVLVDVDAAVEHAMDIATALLRDLAAETGVDRFEAVAAGVPQPINPATGHVESHRIRSGWEGLVPEKLLETRLSMPVRVENDASLGALAEMRTGIGRGVANFVFIKVSTGVGASMVLDGKLFRGSHGLAGEIGHIPVADHSDRCRCGSRGCLETVVSIPAVFDHLAKMGITPGLGDDFGKLLTDPVFDRILHDSGRILGDVLAYMSNMLAPSIIVLGGWLGSMGGEPIIRGASEAIERSTHPGIARHLRLRPAAHGLHAEVRGAVQLAADAVPAPS